MAGYLKCKACGYVTEESLLGDLCPACGVKHDFFIPDPDRISERRRKILDSHIHPIIVHMPQAIPFIILPALLLSFYPHEGLHTHLLNTIRVLATLLPITTIVAYASGILDGKTRFRKLSPPFLQLKMKVGVLFFIWSVIAAILVQFHWFRSPAGSILCAVFIAGCAICSVILGKVGASMANAKFQG